MVIDLMVKTKSSTKLGRQWKWTEDGHSPAVELIVKADGDLGVLGDLGGGVDAEMDHPL